ncbi:MAG: methyltransferase domain-containing protein [archaeon]
MYSSIESKDILEVGCGSSVGVGYYFLDDNIRSWTSSDYIRFPDYKMNIKKNEIKFIREVEKKIGQQIFRKLVTIDMNGRVLFPTRKLRFMKLDICSNQINSHMKYDIIFSNAVLEHLKRNKVIMGIKNMYNLLKKGGIIYHQIALDDHFSPDYPFDFYSYSTETWEKMTGESIFYTNRLRASDFLSLFRKTGFKILSKTLLTKDINNDKIHDCFSKFSSEDLSVYALHVVLKK